MKAAESLCQNLTPCFFFKSWGQVYRSPCGCDTCLTWLELVPHPEPKKGLWATTRLKRWFKDCGSKMHWWTSVAYFFRVWSQEIWKRSDLKPSACAAGVFCVWDPFQLCLGFWKASCRTRTMSHVILWDKAWPLWSQEISEVTSPSPRALTASPDCEACQHILDSDMQLTVDQLRFMKAKDSSLKNSKS